MEISGASDPVSPNHLTESWIDRAARLEKLLTICPRDILVRCDLASVLEELGQYKEALFNWKAVLADDSNNLKAREGMARCRLRIGHPLQSNT
jgi:tetratricopeptide (TPR) repeat protein